MKLRIPFRSILLAAVVVGAVACGKTAPPAPDLRSSALAEVQAASDGWWQAARERDAEKFVTFYAMEAQLLPPDARIVRGRDDVRSAFLTIMSQPNFKVDGGSTRIEAARSGDIAWEAGRFDLTIENSSGQTVTTPGKYVVIWQKRAGGQWRIVSNMFNNDRPASEVTAGLH